MFPLISQCSLSPKASYDLPAFYPSSPLHCLLCCLISFWISSLIATWPTVLFSTSNGQHYYELIRSVVLCSKIILSWTVEFHPFRLIVLDGIGAWEKNSALVNELTSIFAFLKLFSYFLPWSSKHIICVYYQKNKLTIIILSSLCF